MAWLKDSDDKRMKHGTSTVRTAALHTRSMCARETKHGQTHEICNVTWNIAVFCFVFLFQPSFNTQHIDLIHTEHIVYMHIDYTYWRHAQNEYTMRSTGFHNESPLFVLNYFCKIMKITESQKKKTQKPKTKSRPELLIQFQAWGVTQNRWQL